MTRNSNNIFRNLIKKMIFIVFLSNTSVVLAQLLGEMDAIYSGTPWFATSKKITGPYEFKEPLLFNGKGYGYLSR